MNAAEPADTAAELLRMARAFEFPGPGDEDERAADFQNAFDVDGASLYEGFHRKNDGREGIFEDLMRFYAFFGLRLSESGRDYPDHLATELEFLAYLAMHETDARARGDDPRPFQLAQRDFIARHLGVWLPAFARRLGSAGCESPFYPDLANAAAELVQGRRRSLEQALEGGIS